MSHLRELRDRVRNAAIAFVLSFVLAWHYADPIYVWLREPLNVAWLSHSKQLGSLPQMTFSTVTEPFWTYTIVGLWAGIFVASPFIFYQLWQFIAPGLYKRERIIGVVFAIFSALFFVAGALFCYYFALVPMFTYLLGYANDQIRPMLLMTPYLELTRTMMIAFGAVFELPLLIYFLAKIGLVTWRSLWKFNRYFIVLAFIIGAILTPTPDPVGQTIMAMPMVILYNASILVAYVVGRNKAKRKAAEDAANGIIDVEDPDVLRRNVGTEDDEEK